MLNNIILIACTMFLAMLAILLFVAWLYIKEKDKRQEEKDKNEQKFKDDLMSKLDSIGLTTRQKEIQELVMEGKTSQEIAEKLFIEKSTVDTHRKSINVKFKKAKIHKQFIINL